MAAGQATMPKITIDGKELDLTAPGGMRLDLTADEFLPIAREARELADSTKITFTRAVDRLNEKAKAADDQHKEKLQAELAQAITENRQLRANVQRLTDSGEHLKADNAQLAEELDASEKDLRHARDKLGEC